MSEMGLKSPDVPTVVAIPKPFAPHSSGDHDALLEAPHEIEDGVYMDDLSDGAVVEVETKHHLYTIVKRAGGLALISGHPKLCPAPVSVEIEGSVSGSSMKVGFIGRGMHLIFLHPTHHLQMTSRILDIRALR
jgi:hypothetical protein